VYTALEQDIQPHINRENMNFRPVLT